MSTGSSLARLIATFAICVSAGYADLYLFVSSIGVWYETLHRPSFIPSISIIYYGIIAVSSLLAITLYIIWNAAQTNRKARIAVGLFLLALVLNVAWFFIFFREHAVFFSLIAMAMLLLIVIATIDQSLKWAIMSVPFQVLYLLILSVITYANVMIFLMNPGLPLAGVLF